MNSKSALSVVIVGGSLSGLYTAVVLKSLSYVSSITILERGQESELQDQGAGIRTGQESIDAILEFTGVAPEKYAERISGLKTLNKDGVVISNIPIDNWTSTWGQLYRVLREQVDKDTKCSYRHGCKVTDVRVSAQQIVVEFEDESKDIQSVTANLVIGADGASSKVCSLMLPEVKRISAGYVCYRGVVPIADMSGPVQEVYHKSSTFSWPQDSQFVSYVVPADDKPADEAHHMVNWVWYRTRAEDELQSLLTDKQGKKHTFTIGHGHVRQDEIDRLREKARLDLPPAHVEVVKKTAEPFVQVVTDSLATQNSFFGGKVLLIGDAVGGQRPHTASAFLQSAFHALLLRKLVLKQISTDEWSETTRAFSTNLVEAGKQLGIYTQKTGSPEKVGLFMKLFLATQAQLDAMWKEHIGDIKTIR